MEVVIRQNVAKGTDKELDVIYKKMEKAVNRQLKSRKVNLSEYLRFKKKRMFFLSDFAPVGIGKFIKRFQAYKIIFPTKMNFWAFIYLVKKNMVRYSKKKGWLVRSYKKGRDKPKEWKHLTWQKYVKALFPRFTKQEIKYMESGIWNPSSFDVPRSAMQRIAKQYTGDKYGWCQVEWDEEYKIPAVRCYDQKKNTVFHEDVTRMIKLATVIKTKKGIEHGSWISEMKIPKEFAKERITEKPAEKMSDSQLYQLLHDKRGEYIEKIRGEPAGGWKLPFLDSHIYYEARRRKFIKRTKEHGWVLIE